MDVTDYLSLYQLTAEELGRKIMNDIFVRTGIRATCGVGTNMYLTKIALDITAKHSKDFIGVLDERKYINTLWEHQPLTDFWRVGAGTVRRLNMLGIRNMKEITQADEDLLYRTFGVDAELLIDHAWGRESTTIKDIKAYKPKSNSLCSGQVLMRDYDFEEGKLIAMEMVDLMCLELVDKNLITSSITLHVGYSNSIDEKPAHGTCKLSFETSSDKIIVPAVAKLYEDIVDKTIPVRRMSITCNKVVPEEYRQYSFFEDMEDLERNKKLQQAAVETKICEKGWIKNEKSSGNYRSK